jgi:FkbM family methyltransferase
MPFRFVKNMIWNGVARILSRGVSWIRRRPSVMKANDWRAVHFSFSHYGEDLIIFHLLRERRQKGILGIYIDIGAFDPCLFSNTRLLYMNGYRGINIEANPDRIETFRQIRKEDINIHAVVSKDNREVLFLQYPTEGTNRLVELSEINLRNIRGENPTRQTRMKASTPHDLLSPHVKPNSMIDFLNIDCEGEDFAVIQSIDLNQYRPYVIAIEAYDDIQREQVIRYLQDQGYTKVSQNILTLIFADTSKPISDLRVFA